LDELRHYAFPGNVRELEHLLMSASVFVSGDVIEAEDLGLERGASPPMPQSTAGSYEDFKSSERDRIVAALNAHDWNRAKAARSLGMARRTFYRRLKEHGIELPSNS
jgi:transcriptional regulator of acetoin/glycerol metabolism